MSIYDSWWKGSCTVQRSLYELDSGNNLLQKLLLSSKSGSQPCKTWCWQCGFRTPSQGSSWKSFETFIIRPIVSHGFACPFYRSNLHICSYLLFIFKCFCLFFLTLGPMGSHGVPMGSEIFLREPARPPVLARNNLGPHGPQVRKMKKNQEN